jgi:hypothetical protein
MLKQHSNWGWEVLGPNTFDSMTAHHFIWHLLIRDVPFGICIAKGIEAMLVFKAPCLKSTRAEGLVHLQ